MPEKEFIAFLAIFLAERLKEPCIAIEPIAAAAEPAAMPSDIAFIVELFIISPSLLICYYYLAQKRK